MLPRIVSILILGFVQLICVLISLVYLCLSFKFSGWLFPNSDSCIGFVRFDLISLGLCLSLGICILPYDLCFILVLISILKSQN